MANVANVASTVLMGLLLVGVVVAILRSRDWYDYSPTEGEGGIGETLDAIARNPTTWMVSLFVLLLLFGGTAVLFVSGASLPGGVMLIGGAFAVVVAGYVFLGAYSAARSRGRPNSQAVAEGAMLLLLLVAAAIAVRLVVG
jgi:hypothetical protein